MALQGEGVASGAIYGTNGQLNRYHGLTAPTPRQYQPASQAQSLSITGRIPGAVPYAITVLAGYAGPKITGGWPKVNVIDRPLRLGFTVPNGYDPWSMDVPVQFEGVVQQPGSQPVRPATGLHANGLEFDIQKLEWMAGRGVLYGIKDHGGQAGPAAGLPPIVNVISIDGRGNPSQLIPQNLHGMDWVITNIDYDNTVGMSSTAGGQQSSGGVIRDRDGNRIRQACTISLTQYVAAPGAINSPQARQARRTTATGADVVHASQAYNTILKLVEHETSGNALWPEIQQVARYNHIRSVRQPLKLGRKILIPRSVLTVN